MTTRTKSLADVKSQKEFVHNLKDLVQIGLHQIICTHDEAVRGNMHIRHSKYKAVLKNLAMASECLRNARAEAKAINYDAWFWLDKSEKRDAGVVK